MHREGWCNLNSPLNIKKSVLLFMATAITLAFTTMACRDGDIAGDLQWRNDITKHHRYAPIEPATLHYLDIGQGEPVILIHGWADSVYTWHKNLPILVQAGFRIILMDLPGMGESDIPPHNFVYSIENLAQTVINLADHLKLSRFTIAGHSMGGAIALYLCIYYPQKIKHAVAIAPACYRPSHRTGRFLLKIPGVKPLAGVLAGKWAVAFALRQVYYNDALVTDTMVNEYARPFKKPGYVDTITSLALDFFSPTHVQMTQSYDHIVTPLLIIWGDNDLWLPPTMGRRLHKQVNGAGLTIIPNAGHNVHQEANTLVNNHIVEFLATAAKPSTQGSAVGVNSP